MGDALYRWTGTLSSPQPVSSQVSAIWGAASDDVYATTYAGAPPAGLAGLGSVSAFILFLAMVRWPSLGGKFVAAGIAARLDVLGVSGVITIDEGGNAR